MGKEKSIGESSLWQELFLSSALYKRSQGRITRQTTFGALAVAVAIGCWDLFQWLEPGSQGVLHYAIPAVLLGLGCWLSYRVVNIPRFAEFLIAVEAEMNKVSWPTRGELIRAVIVVIFLIFFLAGVLYVFDIAWRYLFIAIGVIHGGT